MGQSEWRKQLLKRIQDNLNDEDEEMLEFLFQQNAFYSNLLMIMDYQPQRGGSRPGRRANVERNRHAGHARLWNDYFSESPVYDEKKFRRRYRMTRRLFNRIHDAVCAHDSYFIQKRDASGLLGLSSTIKMTAALRQLAYGVTADAVDEYCRLGESTAMECLKRFVRAVREIFEAEYLREPTKEDVLQQMKINENRGFRGMFASIDCMHYMWKNCLVAWQGQFQDKDGNRSIILEAVADHSLRFWHAFFGLLGSNNDINVLDKSPLLRNLMRSEAEGYPFVLNGKHYNKYYLLADGIYPSWSVFVKTIHKPTDPKRSFFATCQEGARKDVERAFGVLQARWGIVQNPSRMHHMLVVKDILMACVVLHNMILEDERDENLEQLRGRAPVAIARRPMSFAQFSQGTAEIENEASHFNLRNDLMEHLWKLRGEGFFKS